MVAPLKKALLFAGHLGARFGHWQTAARCIMAADSLGALDDKSRGRLLYALMMCGVGDFSTSALRRLVRDESTRSPVLDCWLAAAAQRLGNVPEAVRLYQQAATSEGPHEDAAAASRMALLLEELASGEAARGIAAQVDSLSLAQDQEIILVSLGENHLPLFDEWLRETRRFAGGLVIAAGLDTTAVAELELRIPGRVIELSRYFASNESGKLHPYSKHALWIVRTLLIKELMGRGHRVLSSDLDAFFVGDVDRMLDDFSSADIIIQEDFSIPMDVARRLGFVLCCGFVFYRPTEATRSFLERFVERVVIEMDDQVAINHMIDRAGIRNVTRTENSLSFESLGVRWCCPARNLVSRDFTSGSVVRHFYQHGETVPELLAKLGLSS